MKNITTEYFFSRTSFFFILIFVLAFTFILSYLSYTTYHEASQYNDKKFVAALFLLGLIFLHILMARRIWTMASSLISNKPALILTPEKLIDNLNRRTINWADIAEINEKFNYSGKTSQQFITITLKNSDKSLKIQDGGIKCKRQELLETLLEYYKSK